MLKLKLGPSHIYLSPDSKPGRLWVPLRRRGIGRAKWLLVRLQGGKLSAVQANRARAKVDIPGKTCGPCSLCCKVLEIEELEKPAGPSCTHCVAGGGCAAYATRPKVCRAFECLWKGDRGLSPLLRPDRVGTLLMEDADSEDYLAVCDPARPLAWRTPLVFNHLVAVAKTGRVVLAKAGVKAWRIWGSGEWGPYA